MNKKFIAILLIFGLLTLGLSMVSAGDVSDDGAVSEEVDDLAPEDDSEISEENKEVTTNYFYYK